MAAQMAPIIVMAIISALGEILKKSPEKKAREQMGLMEEMGYQKPFQNPYLPQMTEAAFKGSLGQMGRTANWGWPEGMGMDTSWIDEMGKNIQPAQAPPPPLDIGALISKWIESRKT